MSQPMNRQQKRMLQRQGQLSEDGQLVASTRERQPRTTRSSPMPRPANRGRFAFFSEVRTELGKVSWPSRAETLNYSVVVFFTLVLVTLFIFGLDYLFSTGTRALFK